MQTTTVLTPFTHEGIDAVVKLYRIDQKVIWPKFVDKITTRQGYYRMAQIGDVPIAGVVNQGTAIPTVNWQTGPYKDWNPIKRGNGVSATREVVRRDVYKIVNEIGPKLGRSLARAVDTDMANFVNLATQTGAGAVTPPGNAAFAGTQTFDGGTYSNVITGNPALSVTALENAVAQMRRMPTAEGDYMNPSGPFDLLVPPELEWLARRITGADKFPQSNDNDPNPISSTIRRIVVDVFFNSTTAWALAATMNADENPMKLIMFDDFIAEEEYDKARQIHSWYVTQIWTRALSDWRNFMYSSGLGS